MYIIMRPLAASSNFRKYRVEWYCQIGDTIKKGELLAKVYYKIKESVGALFEGPLGTLVGGVMAEFLKWGSSNSATTEKPKIAASKPEPEPKKEPQEWHCCDILSPVEGTIRQIFTPSTLSDADIELALISTVPEPLDTINIFYSYASEDELLRKELEKQLSVLRRQGFVVEWHKGDITAGSEWQKQADLYLNTAHIILILASPDFMASDNCYSLEMQKAMQRYLLKEARIIPVLLRPSDWKGSPLAELQALPENTVPITLWGNRDEAFLHVVQGIRKVIQEMIEGYLKHIQNALAFETEQYSSVKQQVFSLSETIGINKKRLQELSREIDTALQQLNLYQGICDKLEAEKMNLETIQTNLQEQLEIIEINHSLSLVISSLRGGIDTNLSQFIGEIKTLRQHVKSYQEAYNKLKHEKANLESSQAKLQKQCEKANLISSMSLEEIEKLQGQKQKTIEMLAKVKF